jgi:tetratricopeptide (TPR) repeat protein
VALALFVIAPAHAQTDEIVEAGKLLRAGQHQQALDRVNKALSSKPRDAQLRFLKGLILAEQGNSKEAIDVFQRLTVDYPSLPEPYNNLAVLFAAQGQYDKARGALEQSIRTHPSYATAYENLGDVYAKLASQAYDKALQIDSSNAGAQNKLALVRELVGGPRTVVAAASTAPAASAPAAPAAPTAPAAPPAAASAPPPVASAAPASKVPPPVATAPAEKAAPAPAATAKPGADPSKDVLASVQAWADAWSRKDSDRYLAAYAKDFRPPKGEARDAWEKGRRERIAAPKSISVTVDAPKVSLSGDKATVSFRQGYRSDSLTANSRKTLVMVRAGDRWLIQQEQVGN